jgi:glutamate N-acetyltransferase/amino-acid N-acetyltransferase
MIRPNMATMLGFVATDACIAPALLQALVTRGGRCQLQPHHHRRRHVDQRFLRADGHAAGRPCADHDRSTAEAARCAMRVTAVARTGAGHRARRRRRHQVHHRADVEGGRDEAECRLVAYAIAHSPLVKTAFFASDPNLGRILAAVGYAGIDDLDQGLIDLHLGRRARGHPGRPPSRLPRGRRPARDEAEPRSPCGCCCTAARPGTVWTCDLSHDYVSINADYRALARRHRRIGHRGAVAVVDADGRVHTASATSSGRSSRARPSRCCRRCRWWPAGPPTRWA